MKVSFGIASSITPQTFLLYLEISDLEGKRGPFPFFLFPPFERDIVTNHVSKLIACVFVSFLLGHAGESMLQNLQTDLIQSWSLFSFKVECVKCASVDLIWISGRTTNHVLTTRPVKGIWGESDRYLHCPSILVSIQVTKTTTNRKQVAYMDNLM